VLVDLKGWTLAISCSFLWVFAIVLFRRFLSVAFPISWVLSIIHLGHAVHSFTKDLTDSTSPQDWMRTSIQKAVPDPCCASQSGLRIVARYQ
jgi:hypothetical protein